jgi:hypothetical protein
VCTRNFLCCVSQTGVRATMVCVVLCFSKKEPVDDVGWGNGLVKIWFFKIIKEPTLNHWFWAGSFENFKNPKPRDNFILKFY